VNLDNVTALGSVLLRLGPKRVALKALHRLRIRTGWYQRRCPQHVTISLSPAALGAARSPFYQPHFNDAARARFASAACEVADRVVGGEIQFFGHLWRPRPGSWRQSALTGCTTSLAHWSTFSDFDSRVGDIKWVWDPSRFDWAYTLGRAWTYSREPKYAETFWRLLEDWIADNPINAGLNWKCGQECGLRVVALCWSAGVFADAPATTPSRLQKLWSLVASLTERVRASLIYSVSQNNNHLLSEALALYVAGHALVDHPHAREWSKVGRAQFLRAVGDQFAPDGYYAQHSWAYSRVALRALLVFLAVAREQDERLPASLLERAARAVDLMRAMLDSATGRLPNYGGNDGSNFASMSACDYLDFRPIVAAMMYLLHGVRLFEDSPAQEELLWLPATDTVDAAATSTTGANASWSGYYRLDGLASRVYVRCGEFRTRPAHADMLHVDLWIGHENVARDAGSYQYFDDRGWGMALEGSAAHNVVTVDGQDQMRRYSRFLWTGWAVGRTLKCLAHPDDGVHWIGEHDGYRRLGVTHRREICGSGDDWLIIDHILRSTRDPRAIALHWHLHPGLEWERSEFGVRSAATGIVIEVRAPGEAVLEVVEGERALPLGGESLRFGALTPRTSLKLVTTSTESLQLITSVGRRSIGSPEWTALWGDRLRHYQKSGA
jgi:hypothetical protein